MDKDVRRFMYVGLGARNLLDRGVSLETEHVERVERLLVQHGIAPHRLLSSDEVTSVDVQRTAQSTRRRVPPLELRIAFGCFHAEFQKVGTQPTAVGDIETMSSVLIHLQTTSFDECDA
jgi:hypothetical protein